MKTVVLISGIASSGKDTLGTYIIKQYSLGQKCTIFYETLKIAFADSVKETLSELSILGIENTFTDSFKNQQFDCLDLPLFNDWQKDTLPTGRDVLIRFAENMKLLLGDNIWAKKVVTNLLKSRKDLIVVPDLRFQVEKDTVVKAMSEIDVKVVHIHIVDITSSLRMSTDGPTSARMLKDADLNKMLDESLNVFNQNETANDDLPLWKSADYFVYSTKSQPIELHNDFQNLVNNSKPDAQA